MVFETFFDLVDNDSGEILTKNKKFTYNTEVPECHLTLLNWLLCFERGLAKGRNLTIQITSKKFVLPLQKDLF